MGYKFLFLCIPSDFFLFFFFYSYNVITQELDTDFFVVVVILMSQELDTDFFC